MIRLQLGKVAGIALITGILLSTTACRGPGRAARKACRAMHECHRAAFEAAYSSMRECIDDQLDDLDDLEREHGRACARAYVRYGHCAARVYMRECNSGDVTRECEDLWDEYWDECYR
jgi:hypothetical protein